MLVCCTFHKSVILGGLLKSYLFVTQYIGKVGTVHRVTERGDIRVQYEGCNHRWTFNPEALTKRNCFSVGDFVRVIHDTDKVKEYQKGHGEWIEVMKSVSNQLPV